MHTTNISQTLCDHVTYDVYIISHCMLLRGGIYEILRNNIYIYIITYIYTYISSRLTKKEAFARKKIIR